MDSTRILKQLPGLRFAYHFMHSRCLPFLFRLKTHQAVFTDICRKNKWAGKESLSGPGSSLCQTTAVLNELPKLCADFDVQTLLDIPCGDFHWMRHVRLGHIDYTGADIVTNLIQQNRRYETLNIHFCKLDLIEDRMPKADLVLCRDCLVHLSYKDIFRALRNICASGST